MPLPPAPYDIDKYPHIWDCPQASVDRRHLFWMHDVLCAGGFTHALEIGCLNGASSTVFVDAINRNRLGRATFCDIDIRSNLLVTLDCCADPERVQTYEGCSVDLLRERNDFDFVFVDGDHRLEVVRDEVELLLRFQPTCVMAHDTGAQAGGEDDCDGPPFLKWRFQTTAPYLCLEDTAPRLAEETYRGMFLATTSPELFEAARKSLQKWGRLGDQSVDSG